jgi:hypothetical protein
VPDSFILLFLEQYTKLLGHSIPPTQLWNSLFTAPEQVVSVSIDNSSVFVPGGSVANSQYGFRRTELIAQVNQSAATADSLMEVNTTAFHFSIFRDESRPLNYSHEYQVVFIEPGDGSHVFGVQLGLFIVYDHSWGELMIYSRFPVYQSDRKTAFRVRARFQDSGSRPKRVVQDPVSPVHLAQFCC